MSPTQPAFNHVVAFEVSKHELVVLTATMRKLDVILNAVFKSGLPAKA